VVVANDNAPGQVVVAGDPGAVARAAQRAREEGGRALPLEVEGAFHSPAMEPAVAAVEETLLRLEVRDPEVPLVSGTTGAPVRDSASIAAALTTGILSPVRWREVQEALAGLGAGLLVELGPGGVLKGLARRTVPDLAAHAVAGPEDLESVARLVTLDRA
jgi:[acyl-carrier-protein] S-malonyltransferase